MSECARFLSHIRLFPFLGACAQLRELDGDLMGMADTIERLTKQRDGAQARATAAEKERAELAAMIEQVTKDNSQALEERDKYRAELATVRRKSLERTGSSSSRGSTGDSEEKYRTQLVMAKVKLAEERSTESQTAWVACVSQHMVGWLVGWWCAHTTGLPVLAPPLLHSKQWCAAEARA